MAQECRRARTGWQSCEVGGLGESDTGGPRLGCWGSLVKGSGVSGAQECQGPGLGGSPVKVWGRSE